MKYLLHFFKGRQKSSSGLCQIINKCILHWFLWVAITMLHRMGGISLLDSLPLVHSRFQKVGFWQLEEKASLPVLHVVVFMRSLHIFLPVCILLFSEKILSDRGFILRLHHYGFSSITAKVLFLNTRGSYFDIGLRDRFNSILTHVLANRCVFCSFSSMEFFTWDTLPVWHLKLL